MLAEKYCVLFGKPSTLNFSGDDKVSRIGKNPINIPNGVQVTLVGNGLKVKGPKGELGFDLLNGIKANIENNVLTFSRDNDLKKVRSVHGLTRAIVAGMVEGVSNGFQKTLTLIGVGFRAEMKRDRLLLSLGFSHPIAVIPPKGISFEVPNQTTVVIKGIDKQLLGEVASKIRDLRPPEPYKGKGVRYENEYVRRKAGKTSSK